VRPCEVCGDSETVGLVGRPCPAPGCTRGQVQAVVPQTAEREADRLRAAVTRCPRCGGAEREAELQASICDWGDRAARAEERALAAEQERDQWRARAGVLEAERDEERQHRAVLGGELGRVSRSAEEVRLLLEATIGERDEARRHLSPPCDDDTNGARLVREGEG